MRQGLVGVVRRKIPRRDYRIKRMAFTALTLREHLESQFLPGMTWENYGMEAGQWQIDHIRPISSFDLTDPDQVAACWELTNLRPLWTKENRKKGTSYANQ